MLSDGIDDEVIQITGNVSEDKMRMEETEHGRRHLVAK